MMTRCVSKHVGAIKWTKCFSDLIIYIRVHRLVYENNWNTVLIEDLPVCPHGKCKDDFGALAELFWEGKSKVLEATSVKLPTCLLQISHGLAQLVYYKSHMDWPNLSTTNLTRTGPTCLLQISHGLAQLVYYKSHTEWPGVKPKPRFRVRMPTTNQRLEPWQAYI
jgi:hypothetical protein